MIQPELPNIAEEIREHMYGEEKQPQMELPPDEPDPMDDIPEPRPSPPTDIPQQPGPIAIIHPEIREQEREPDEHERILANEEAEQQYIQQMVDLEAQDEDDPELAEFVDRQVDPSPPTDVVVQHIVDPWTNIQDINYHTYDQTPDAQLNCWLREGFNMTIQGAPCRSLHFNTMAVDRIIIPKLVQAGLLIRLSHPTVVNDHFYRQKPTKEIRLIFDGTNINNCLPTDRKSVV